MDEATSSLVNNTEANVVQAIQNLNCNSTLIMIAYRLSTVEECDRLFYVDSSQIKHADTYEELLGISCYLESWKPIKGVAKVIR